MFRSDSPVRAFIDIIGFLLISVVAIIHSIIKQCLPKSYQNLKQLKGEIALVTGGGNGLGRLIALRLAKLEAIVVLWDVNEEGLDETINQIRSIGGTAYGFKCDLVNKDDVYRVAEETRKQIGDVTILINNAGVVNGHYLLDTPDELIKLTFDVNVLAHFWTTKSFLPKMMETNHGHIVTIASMAGYVGISKLVDYCSSKYAAVGFDEALRVELDSMGKTGVKTTCVCPYFIQSTGMFGNVNSRFLSTLKSTDVADKVIEGLQKEEVVIMLPAMFKAMIIFKFLVPWSCTSMFLRGLVKDAYPTDESESSVASSEKSPAAVDVKDNFASNKNLIMKNYDHLNGHYGKNL